MKMPEKKIMDVTENSTLVAFGIAASNARTSHGGIPYAVVPEGFRLRDLESLLPAPARKRAKVTLQDAKSFIEYIKKHGSLDNCTLYADVNYEAFSCSLIAVINDNGADVSDAQWRDHTATFVPELSHEWKAWTRKNQAVQAQSDFASFLEENMSDIANIDPGMPTASEMLQMALDFEMHSNKRFKKTVDLQSGGVALEYVDQADENTTMRLYKRFVIGIPVFQNSSSAYPIQARLKFRQNADRLVFWFELVRSDRVYEQAVKEMIEKIHDETGCMLLYGTPGF
jgi:uncharacterized protein YfdQ (DUF2303 family)